MSVPVYVHDRVVFLWGAEAMLGSLMRHFGVEKETKVFVLYSTHEFFVVDGAHIPIVTALPRRINKLFAWWGVSTFSVCRRLFDYRNLMFFYPMLCWLLQKKIQQAQPSHVVISSFAAVKNVVPAAGWQIPTTLYLHSPMQYIWENYDEYMMKLTWLKKQLFRLAARYLRPRDKKHRAYTVTYANSGYTAQCAEKYYGMMPNVRYPELHPLFFSTQAVVVPRDYFIYVGRLVRFIREVDRIIALCTQLHLPLLVVGSGPDEDYLKSIAWPTVTFVGQVTEVEEKILIVKHARWLINLAKESCGIATMEALCLWVPVFAYAAGGSREIVTWSLSDTVSDQDLFVTDLWILVADKSSTTLHRGMKQFIQKKRERLAIQEQMRKKLSRFSSPL
jgi:glycosyltransferase involved in cell wall biosynthesis